MSQQPPPWRVNDAVLHDALRDEFRSSIAASLMPAGNLGHNAVGSIQELQAAFYDVDGFDRAEVTQALTPGDRGQHVGLGDD